MQFDAHINIFKYLNLKSLLQVQQVNRMWRLLSNDPSLWTSVDLEGMAVKDWRAFFNFACQKNIKSLDLSKMNFPDGFDPMHTWSEFAQAISGAKTIEKINLCRCPSYVVDAIIQNCPQMQVINLEDCYFSISEDLQSIHCSQNNVKRDISLNLKTGTVEERRCFQRKLIFEKRHCL